MAIRTYRDLEVFQQSYAAALDVSKLAKRFPPYENLELGRQIRRAARSIPANIVEGWAKRNSTLEFKRYLQMAVGSCDEVKLWLEIGKDEGYIPEEIYRAQLSRYNRIGAMLASLWKIWHKSPS
jgi:four helix bundle protein